MSDVKLIPFSEWPMFEDPENGQVYIVSEKGHWHGAESFIKTVDEVLTRHKVGEHQRKEPQDE